MKKIIKILVIILAVLLAIAAFLTFFPSESADASSTELDILGNGTISENGTLNIKLSSEGVALKDKEINVVIKDGNGNVVFEDSAQTQVNGVANVKVENLSPSEYEVSVAFEGDENYSSSNITEKLVITQVAAEEDDGSDEDAGSDVETDTQAGSSSYSGRSYYNGGSSDSGSSNVPADSGSSDTPPADDGGSESGPAPEGSAEG